MKKYQIIFHVDEMSEDDARKWLDKVSSILTAYRDKLVSSSTGAGTWCSGHFELMESSESGSSAQNVLQMGPRQ